MFANTGSPSKFGREFKKISQSINLQVDESNLQVIPFMVDELEAMLAVAKRAQEAQ